MSTLKWSESLIHALCRICWISSSFHTRYAGSWHILHCTLRNRQLSFQSTISSLQLPITSLLCLFSLLDPRAAIFTLPSNFFSMIHTAAWFFFPAPFLTLSTSVMLTTFCLSFPPFLSWFAPPLSFQCQQSEYPPCEHETDQRADEYHHLVKHGRVRPLDRPVEIILQRDRHNVSSGTGSAALLRRIDCGWGLVGKRQ